MSSKNILQEYCQKNKIPMPIYNTVIIGGTQTIPIFESTLIFNKNTYCATGATKIMAEKKVAQSVYQSLPTITRSIIHIVTPTFKQKYCSIQAILGEQYHQIYLIDGDNCHITDDKIFEDNSNLFIYFVAKNNTRPYPFLHQEKYDNCCVFISDSTNRDATDHLLTFNLGKMSILWKDKKYYIVTKDHFGECLEKFMTNCQFICSI